MKQRRPVADVQQGIILSKPPQALSGSAKSQLATPQHDGHTHHLGAKLGACLTLCQNPAGSPKILCTLSMLKAVELCRRVPRHQLATRA